MKEPDIFWILSIQSQRNRIIQFNFQFKCSNIYVFATWWYFDINPFEQTDVMGWKIKGLRHRAEKIWELDIQNLWKIKFL